MEQRTTSYIDDNGKKKTGVTAYNPSTDYSDLIGKAEAANDYAAAGYYEQQRNQKIADQGLSYAPTNKYQNFYGQVDDQRAAALEKGYQTQAQQLQEQGYYNTILDNLKTNRDQQLAANDEQSAAQIAMQQEALERQKQQQAEQYGKVNRQLYVDTRQNERRLPEQLAAMGYTGGASETAMLRNRLSYEQALRDNEAARIAGEQDIDFQGRQMQAQQEIARQQAAMQINSDYNTGYNSVLGQLQSQANYEAEQAHARQQQGISYAIAAAETLAQHGDFSGYAKVTDMNGNRLYTDEQIAAMKAQYDALVAAQSFSSGGSGGGRGGTRRYYSDDYDGEDDTTQDISNWQVSNKAHEDIDYSNSQAVSYSAAAENTVKKLMTDGRDKSYVSGIIEEYYQNGYISDDTYRRLKASNSARDNSGSGVHSGGGGGKQATQQTR